VEFLCQKLQFGPPLAGHAGISGNETIWLGDFLLEARPNSLHTRQFAKRQRTWFRAYPKLNGLMRSIRFTKAECGSDAAVCSHRFLRNNVIQDKQQRNWKPIIKQFEAVVGKMV